MDLSIRPVGAADVDALLPLMRAYCAFYGATPSDVALEAMTRHFLDTGGREGTQLLARDVSDLTDQPGRPVGHATILWSWDTTLAAPLAVMEDLFVAPQARGTGVGRALLEACQDEARRRGAVGLDWLTAPDNVRAQRLYDATGAHRGEWVSYRLPTS